MTDKDNDIIFEVYKESIFKGVGNFIDQKILGNPSPEERRVRNQRDGIITARIHLATAINDISSFLKNLGFTTSDPSLDPAELLVNFISQFNDDSIHKLHEKARKIESLGRNPQFDHDYTDDKYYLEEIKFAVEQITKYNYAIRDLKASIERAGPDIITNRRAKLVSFTDDIKRDTRLLNWFKNLLNTGMAAHVPHRFKALLNQYSTGDPYDRRADSEADRVNRMFGSPPRKDHARRA